MKVSSIFKLFLGAILVFGVIRFAGASDWVRPTQVAPAGSIKSLTTCNFANGTCTISDAYASNSVDIFCTRQNLQGISTPVSLAVSNRNAGVNYSITSASTNDSSRVNCMVVG